MIYSSLNLLYKFKILLTLLIYLLSTHRNLLGNSRQLGYILDNLIVRLRKPVHLLVDIIDMTYKLLHILIKTLK